MTRHNTQRASPPTLPSLGWGRCHVAVADVGARGGCWATSPNMASLRSPSAMVTRAHHPAGAPSNSLCRPACTSHRRRRRRSRSGPTKCTPTGSQNEVAASTRAWNPQLQWPSRVCGQRGRAVPTKMWSLAQSPVGCPMCTTERPRRRRFLRARRKQQAAQTGGGRRMDARLPGGHQPFDRSSSEARSREIRRRALARRDLAEEVFAHSTCIYGRPNATPAGMMAPGMPGIGRDPWRLCCAPTGLPTPPTKATDGQQ